MGLNPLNDLAACSMHKEVIATIPEFKTRVLCLFANRKERQAQLLYK